MKPSRILSFFIFLLVVDVLLDPGNLILGIKELLFVSIFIIWLATKPIRLDLAYFYLILFVALILPLYGLLIGLIRQENFILSESLQYFKGFIFFSLLLVTTSKRIDISKFLIYGGFIIALITIWLFFDIKEFSLEGNYYLVEKRAATISKRAFANILFDPMVFYKTSPVLLFPLSYFLDRSETKITVWNILAIILFTSALIISATRANILSAGILIFLFLYNKIKHRWRIIFYILVPLTIIVSLILLPDFFRTYVFNPNEISNSIKIGHLQSYITLFRNDFLSFVFGQGMGAGFYSFALDEMVYKTELTYLEMIRMFGFLFTSVFIFILALPVYIFHRNSNSKQFTRYRYIHKAYFLYLILEISSNPLLIGSTGMIVIVAVFSAAFILNKSTENESS